MTSATAQQVELLAVWSEESVRVGEVLAAMEALRRPEPMPATRASVLTLVVVVGSARAAARTTEAVRALAGRHPARVVTLLVDRSDTDGPPRLDAEVRLLGGVARGHDVWFEDVELHVQGRVVHHLDSLIEPLTQPDLPVVAWFAEHLPSAGDPLLGAAHVVLVDSRDFGDVDCFSTLGALADRIDVVDLSWIRLRPVRELFAGLFDGPEFQPFVVGAQAAEVGGRTGPRHLIGGWLSDRLRLPERSIELEDSEHVHIRVSATDASGRHGSFSVSRDTGERIVRARAEIEGGPVAESVVRLPDATPAWGLAEALGRLERDAAWQQALRSSLVLAGRF